jgi:hypothetical protein
MKGTLFTLAFGGVLALLFGLYVESTASEVADEIRSTAAEGETLSFAKLVPGERIAIAYRSAGCFHDRERLYQVDGGPLRFAAAPLRTDESSAGRRADPELFARLRDEEARGLDAWLMFLRQRIGGGCTTQDYFVVGYYRNGEKIGEERFHDGTCILSGFHWEKGRVVVPAGDRPVDFLPEWFRLIVPPRVIEQRLEAALVKKD